MEDENNELTVEQMQDATKKLKAKQTIAINKSKAAKKRLFETAELSKDTRDQLIKK